jgi:hypothetical protein
LALQERVCPESAEILSCSLLNGRGVGSATDAIPLPQPKPRAVGVLLIVLSIGSQEVARAHGSRIRHGEDALEPLDFRDGLLGVHFLSISNRSTPTVKRDGRKRRVC